MRWSQSSYFFSSPKMIKLYEKKTVRDNCSWFSFLKAIQQHSFFMNEITHIYMQEIRQRHLNLYSHYTHGGWTTNFYWNLWIIKLISLLRKQVLSMIWIDLMIVRARKKEETSQIKIKKREEEKSSKLSAMRNKINGWVNEVVSSFKQISLLNEST